VRKIEPVNFVLQWSSRAKPFVVHVNKLRKCFGSTPTSWLKLELEDSRGEIATGDGVLTDTCVVSGPSVEDDGDFQGAQDVSDAGEVRAPLPKHRRLCRIGRIRCVEWKNSSRQ